MTDSSAADPTAGSWVAGLLAGRGDPAPLRRLAGTDGAHVYAGTRLVCKVHAPATRPADLGRRLRAATSLPSLLPPATADPVTGPDGSVASLWPLAVPVAAESVSASTWGELGVLLARLHRSAVPDLPPAEPLARLGNAVAALPPAGDDGRLLRRLAAGLTRRPVPAGPVGVVHGDVHLGQLATDADGSLRLLDVDDLAVGEPVWDLARAAGFRAAGLLHEKGWQGLVTAYRRAGGPALPATGDPWPALDRPARVAVVTAAANALSGRRHYRGRERRALIATCRSMARSGS